MERLSAAEGDCAREALDDDSYNLLLVSPLSPIRRTPHEAGLVGCLSHENFLIVASAIADATFGGRTAETRECILGVHRGIPTRLYQTFGLEYEGQAASIEEVNQVAQGVYLCMNPRERAAWMLTLWDALGDTSPLKGRDFVPLLTTEEMNCATEALGPDDSERLLDERPFAVWRAYTEVRPCFNHHRLGAIPACAAPMAEVRPCFNHHRLGAMFAFFVAEQVDAASSTEECMADFAADKPDFISVVVEGRDAASTRDEGALIKFGADAFAFFDCLSNDERERFQLLFLLGRPQS